MDQILKMGKKILKEGSHNHNKYGAYSGYHGAPAYPPQQASQPGYGAYPSFGPGTPGYVQNAPVYPPNMSVGRFGPAPFGQPFPQHGGFGAAQDPLTILRAFDKDGNGVITESGI